MTAPLVMLQEAAPAADTEFNFAQLGTHPADGLVAQYILRIKGTIASSNAGGDNTTYTDWRDTILPGLIPLVQLFAPRYSAQLCSANLDGNFWAKQYEDKYDRAMCVLVAGVQVELDAVVNVPNVAATLEIDVVIPFELPKLGADRLWSAPPASLFRGDMSLKFKWHATQAFGGHTLTMTLSKARLLVATEPGDAGKVPIIHRFERRTYSTGSNDIGRGFVFFLTDSNAPDETNTYNMFLDGLSYNGGALFGNDFAAAERAQDGDTQLEERTYTKLAWVKDASTVSQLQFAQNSLAVQQTGATSGTYDIHMADPASSGVVQQNLAQALGIPPGVQTHALPVTPHNAPHGTVRQDIAMAGPRTLNIQGAPVKQATKTIPTVPAGSAGGGIARRMLGK